MPPETPAEKQLTKLNQEIEQLEADSTQLDEERRRLAKEVGRARRRVRYLRAAQLFRRPNATFEMWPIAAIVLGPIIAGVLLFVLVNLVTGSFGAASLGFLFGAGAGLALVKSLLYRPRDGVLPAKIAEADSQRRVCEVRLEEVTERLGAAKDNVQRLLEERRLFIASGKAQRAALLQRNWKAMRDAEWEDYLVEVFRTLGATVRRTGRIGDQGVDLIVEFGERCIAVQAKGYYHAVNSRAVQEAAAGMPHYRCNACAVVTNSRFTKGAKELAESNRCLLIGEDEFPDLVMGKIEL